MTMFSKTILGKFIGSVSPGAAAAGDAIQGVIDPGKPATTVPAESSLGSKLLTSLDSGSGTTIMVVGVGVLLLILIIKK